MTTKHYTSIREIHSKLVGGFVFVKFPHAVISWGWDEPLARKLIGINPRRAAKRVASYVPPEELERVKGRIEQGKDFSLRMGVQKGGAGNFGERGDFCLLGVSHSGTTLTMHYRSLELFGGLVYDQAIILHLIEQLGIRVKKVVMMCASAHTFAREGNSNEALFHKIWAIYKEQE